MIAVTASRLDISFLIFIDDGFSNRISKMRNNSFPVLFIYKVFQFLAPIKVMLPWFIHKHFLFIAIQKAIDFKSQWLFSI